MSVLLTDAEATEVLRLIDAIERSGITRPAVYAAIAENIRRELAHIPRRRPQRQAADARMKGA